MLYSPITTAVVDVYILLLEFQRVMNWKCRFKQDLLGHLEAFGAGRK